MYFNINTAKKVFIYKYTKNNMINNLLSSYLWHGYNFKEYDDKAYLMWLLSEIENNGDDDDFSNNYLTFEALEDTTFTFTRNPLQYSLDNGATWETLAANTASPTVTSGSTIMWKQTGLTPDEEGGIGTFSSTGNYNAYGNVMSLYYGDDFVGQTDLTERNFAFLFSGYVFEDDEYIETYLIDASNLVLPATTLAQYCYASMFDGCTSLVTAPELPATTLADACYNSMFKGCSSLSYVDIHANEEINFDVYDNANGAYGKLVLHGDTPLASQDSFLQQFIGWELWIDDTLIGPIEGSGGEYYDYGGVK